MTSERPEPPPRPDELVDEEEIRPGDLVIELRDGVPHVYTHPEEKPGK